MNIEGLSQIPQEAAVSAGFPKGRAFPACLHAPGFFHGVPGRLIRVKVLSLLASAALLAAAGSAPAAESVAAGAAPEPCAECDDDGIDGELLRLPVQIMAVALCVIERPGIMVGRMHLMAGPGLGVVVQDAFAGFRDDAEFSIEHARELRRDGSGRVASVVLGGVEVGGIELRSLFSLRSTAFELTYDSSAFTFTVTGFGHGVGMSQYGADKMARQGADYVQILTHYYPGTILVK